MHCKILTTSDVLVTNVFFRPDPIVCLFPYPSMTDVKGELIVRSKITSIVG